MDKISKLKYLSLPLILVLLIAVIYNIGFSNLYTALLSANPRYLIIAVLFQSSAILVRNLKWQIFVNGIKKTPFFSLLPMSLAGGFVDFITPGPQVGGGPLKAYFLSKRIKTDKATCLTTVLVERITGLGVLLFFGICSMFFVLIFIRNVPLMLKILLEFVLFLILGVPILGYILKVKYAGKSFKGKAIISRIYYFGPLSSLRNKFTTLQAFDEYITQKLSEFAQTFSGLARDSKKVSVNIILAFVCWILTFAGTYVLFSAFGLRVSFFAVMIVISLSIFLSYFLFLPGGAGVTELMMITLYHSFGIPSAIAASVALLDRFIFYMFAIGFGYISLHYLNYKYGKY